MTSHLLRSAAVSFVLLAGCSSAAPQPVSPDLPNAPPLAGSATPVAPAGTSPDEAAARAIVAQPDRSAEDKAIDGGRHPVDTLTFFHIKPGMKVADLASGRGYTTELLSRAVGPTGVVYAQNNKAFLEKFAAQAIAERMAKPSGKNIVRVDRELDDPLPPEAKDLDVVFDILSYHDTVWMNVDRDKMNAAVFKALKPGGVYAIIDHNARAGSGLNDVKTFHRIEESAIKAEILKAGFKLQAEADFLRNAADTHDWNDSPKEAGARRGTSDRFVLAFVKP